ncbi:NmrA-like family protein [Paecilomyces variotii No. 5]|uniref:NmrA-like family protein n=1 Tax=Byssochlamys spectabilis (strain No. 5 / NBRC 109023) TaxID=1356009 RepID=V5FP17_BYSSN|nr:NmrA-like family protein [Paecilomyces variotii No. 5]
MTLKYLITGATGGLGAEVLNHFISNVPTSQFAVASSTESNRKQFEDRGIAFRVLNYDDKESLSRSLTGVENLLFVSSNTFDNERRAKQHQNVVEAAKRAGVGHVWYTSLAFGGLKSNSKASIQLAHLATEQLLEKSGITYTSIREGIYAEAFPIFLGWYPDTRTVYLPFEGRAAYTSRIELGEATARLMIRGGYEKQTVLLTAQEVVSFQDIVDVINETTGRNVELKFVSPDEYVRILAEIDQGGKPAAFFKSVVSWYEALRDGDGETKDALMADVLGREPKGAKEVIRELLSQDLDYTWHQNYLNRERNPATVEK